MIAKLFKWVFVFSAMASGLLFFTNCGSSSSSSNPQDDAQSDSTLWQGGTLQSLSSMEGTWIQGRCVAISGGSVRTFYKVLATGVDKADLGLGNMFYSGNAVCSGSGSNMGETNIGAATFKGTDDYGSKKYYYSKLKMVSGLEQNYVFALKNSSTICIFHRTSDLVSAQDVNSFVDATNSLDCHSK